MDKNINGANYFPALDGLRGIAIIFVILYHYLGFIAFFDFGWMGVELFFVLSGFLISARLIPFLGQEKVLERFYWNRFVRIVPLYFTFLVLFFSFWFLFTSGATRQEHPFYSDHYWHFFLFIQNWAFIFDFSQLNNHLQPLWSLAVEEQIYLLYPLLLLFFYRKEKFILIASVAIIGIGLGRTIYYELNSNIIDYKQIYWNTFFQFDSFLCGAVIYHLHANNRQRYPKWINLIGIASLAALAIGILLTKSMRVDNTFFTTIGRTILAVFFAYILWICVTTKDNMVKKLLTTKGLIFTGKISYGLFIFHWPLLFGGFALLHKLAPTLKVETMNSISLYIYVLICLILSYIFSYLSFRYYESYFLKWKKKMK